jgi:ZIP family zinc transporter
MDLSEPTLRNAIVASMVAGAGATTLGALPVLAFRHTSERTRAALSGFGAGVMLAASVFSLLVPALEQRPGLLGAVVVGVALLAGAGFVSILNALIPHEHFLKGREGRDLHRLKRTWLFVLAITLHNFPEGLAVGVGVGSGTDSVRLPITIGIGLQNAPEGFVVAASLAREGYALRTALFVAFLSGLVEPIGAAIGFGALGLAERLLPIALAASAGAMLYVISDEVIPESHSGPHAGAATAGTLIGFVTMMILDTALG